MEEYLLITFKCVKIRNGDFLSTATTFVKVDFQLQQLRLTLRMINYVKGCKRLIYFASFLVENNKRVLNNRTFLIFKNYSSQVRLFSVFQSRGLLVTHDQSQLMITRNKSKEKKKKRKIVDEESSDEEEEENDDDDDDDEDEVLDVNEKKLTVSSLRADLILKAVLGISRKKVEANFYENKIRVNGNILLKKSQKVNEGDEIDLIIRVEDFKTDTLNIGRVKILNVKPKPENNKFVIKVWRSKSLIVKNYEGSNIWVETEESN